MKLGKYIFLYGNGPLDLTTSNNCNLEIIGDVLVDFGWGVICSSILTDVKMSERFKKIIFTKNCSILNNRSP